MMQVITRYNKPRPGKVTVSLEHRRILTSHSTKEAHEWKGLKTKRGVVIYAEHIFPITDTAAITDCQNKFYQQMSERIEVSRRSLTHLPAAVSRTGNKRKD